MNLHENTQNTQHFDSLESVAMTPSPRCQVDAKKSLSCMDVFSYKVIDGDLGKSCWVTCKAMFTPYWIDYQNTPKTISERPSVHI